MLEDLLECFDGAVTVGGAVASSGSSTTACPPLPPEEPVEAGFGDDATLDDEVDEVDDAVDSFRRSL